MGANDRTHTCTLITLIATTSSTIKNSPFFGPSTAAATVLVALRFYDEELWHMQSQNTTL